MTAERMTVTIDCDRAVPILNRAAEILRNGGDEHPAAQAVRAALLNPDDWRDEDAPCTSAAARKALANVLDLSESYLPASALATVNDCDVAPMIEMLVHECTEIDIADKDLDRIEIVWRVKAGSSLGAVVLGTCKPVGKREREAWRGEGRAPFWRLTLGLDTWLLMTPEQRWRLLHHELMHATYKGDAPSGRMHDIEEFAATVARYGFLGEMQAKFVGQAMGRDTIAADLAEFEVDATTGQGLLFGTDLRPVGW